MHAYFHITDSLRTSKRLRQAKLRFLQTSNVLKRKLEASYQISLGEDIEKQEPEPKKNEG